MNDIYLMKEQHLIKKSEIDMTNCGINLELRNAEFFVIFKDGYE